ncbi:unnamed protein product [Rangifer tarandus platyrhynchus]|uniref:Uncharacterized protein n=1 Tax=Rangifer tarandus platyrhynchus TaxID=3082113 RepID=A0AC59YIU6_RANTA
MPVFKDVCFMHTDCVWLCVRVCVCVCVCVSGQAYIKTSSPLNNWRSHLKPSFLFLSYKVSEPSILESPGPEGPGKQNCGGGEGRTPTAAPHSYTGVKHVILTQGQVGWRGRAPRR